MFLLTRAPPVSTFFFFNDTATTEIYTLSLHDALPISFNKVPIVSNNDKTKFLSTAWRWNSGGNITNDARFGFNLAPATFASTDRKSTRLNSSHLVISYAVFCLKKKKHTPSSRMSVDRS